MKEQTLPDPTQVDGAPHPRETERLIGQAPAEAAFLDAFNTGRLHHAWMLVGPKGVGKATLAWRIARFLLATPDPDPEGDAGLFGAPPARDAGYRRRSSGDAPQSRRLRAGALCTHARAQ